MTNALAGTISPDKLVSAEDAVRHIRPGDRVFIGSACGEPQDLVRAHGPDQRPPQPTPSSSRC